MKTKTALRALTGSVVMMMLCLSMLVGTTLAWFSETVSANGNKIISGTLDLEVYYSKTGNGTDWAVVREDENLFSDDLWEPGHTEVIYLKVVNEGNLAFNYAVNVSPIEETGAINQVGESFLLSDYLVFGTTQPSITPIAAYADREEAMAAVADTSLGLKQSELQKSGVLYGKDDVNTPAGCSDTNYFALIVYMPTTVGNEANTKTGTAAPQIDLGITVVAEQQSYESDSFDDQYDASRKALGTDEYNYTYIYAAESDKVEYDPYDGATLDAKDAASIIRASAVIPASTEDNPLVVTTVDSEQYELEDTSKLKLTITPSDDNDGDITIGTGSSATTYDVTMLLYVNDDTQGTEIKALSDEILVKLEIGVVELQEFYHKQERYYESYTVTDVDHVSELSYEDREYYYDVDSGFIYFRTKSLSPFTSVYRFAGGLGTDNYPYLLATGGHWAEMCKMYPWDEELYPGLYYIYPSYGSDLCYVKLIDDIDFSGWELPNETCVYYLDLDGNGHTLSNVNSPCSLFARSNANAAKKGSLYVRGIYAHDLTIENCSYNYAFGYYLYGGNGIISNVNFKNCEFNDGLFHSVYGYTLNVCDCTYTDCNATNSAICYGSGIKTSVINLDNVVTKNCSFGGGSFLYYGGENTTHVNINDCHTKDTVVLGGARMAIGGFIGHCGQNIVTITNSSFGGSIVSTTYQAGGFIGQKNGTTPVLQNCTVTKDTTIRNTSDYYLQAVAFIGNVYPLPETCTGNVFEGTIFSTNINNCKGAEFIEGKNWFKHITIDKNSFTFAEDGTLTYTGTDECYKIVATQYITINRFDGNTKAWGYGYNRIIGNALVAHDVTQNTVLGTLPYVKNCANLINEKNTMPLLFSTDDTSLLDDCEFYDSENKIWYFKNGLLIIDSRPHSNGTYSIISWADAAVAPESLTMQVAIDIYALSGDKEIIVNSDNIYYSFTPQEL